MSFEIRASVSGAADCARSVGKRRATIPATTMMIRIKNLDSLFGAILAR